MCENLGRRAEIYQLKNWSVIENLYRLKEELKDNFVTLKYDSQKGEIPVKDKTGMGFFVSHDLSILEDAGLENTEVNRLDDACLGCVQCPAMLSFIRSQEPSDIWFRPITC
jgi:hypothetical protein